MPARILPIGPSTKTAQTLVDDAADPTTLELILRRCIQDGECLIWTGGRATQGGYGITWINGKPMLVHRAAFLAYYGDLPEGSLGHESSSVEIHHSCINRLCASPLHHTPLSRKQHNAEHIELRMAA
jgi:HNH endonuclease